MHTAQNIDASDQYRQGVQAYRRGEYRLAIDLLADCSGQMDLQGRIARYYHTMAHRHLGIETLRHGRYAEAQEHLKTAVQTLGATADLADYLASLYAQTNRPRQCAVELDKAAGSGESPAELLRRLALAQWQSGQREQAFLTLSAASRKFPTDASLHKLLGAFYAADEQYDLARTHVEKAALLDCGDADTRYTLGLIEAARGDALAATRALQRALELRPGDILIAYQLSLAAKSASEHGKAVVLRIPETQVCHAADSRNRQLSELIASESEFVESFLELPRTDADAELFEMLAGAVKMALASHPTYADLHYQCARLVDRLGRADECEEHLKHAIRINRRYVKARLELANKLSQSGRLDEAMEHVWAAIKCGADWPDVHCLAGEILCRTGRREQGREHFARALELNGNYRRAAVAIESLAA